MIKGRCRTNIDKFHREEWPEKFTDNIAIGNSVVSKTGCVLKIVNITHAELIDLEGDGKEKIPGIIIELHTSDGHIPR